MMNRRAFFAALAGAPICGAGAAAAVLSPEEERPAFVREGDRLVARAADGREVLSISEDPNSVVRISMPARTRDENSELEAPGALHAGETIVSA